MNLLQALLLGVVEGLTEFLPVSSTGHLTIVERLFGLQVNAPGVTAFTAIIQVGAIVAVIVYFRRDIARLLSAWLRGLLHPEHRHDRDYRLAWYVIVGTIPIGVVGIIAKGVIAGPLRNLWFVVAGLILWSIVMFAAERVGAQRRSEEQTTLTDSLVIGAFQCIALIPGVSRSGATISAGLFRDLERTAATRISFFLAIPALIAAGGYEAATSIKDVSTSVGWTPTLVATVVSFVIAYASIAWLLRLVAHHPITVFIAYRVLLGVLLAGLLLAGILPAA